MELLLSRSQKGGLTGTSFVLDVRTRLTDEEAEYVRKYKIGDTILYAKDSVREKMASSGAVGQLVTHATAKLTGKSFSINDLVNGRSVQCKDILEMLDAEEQIKSAAESFYNILMTCREFGGEEVIAYPREE